MDAERPDGVAVGFYATVQLIQGKSLTKHCTRMANLDFRQSGCGLEACREAGLGRFTRHRVNAGVGRLSYEYVTNF